MEVSGVSPVRLRIHDLGTGVEGIAVGAAMLMGQVVCRVRACCMVRLTYRSRALRYRRLPGEVILRWGCRGDCLLSEWEIMGLNMQTYM